MSALGEYLRDSAKAPWAWSAKDCCTFVADWCIRVGYPDPMAWIRGTYATEEEAMAQVRKHGLLKLAARGFASIGLKRTRVPQDGDVAVVKTLTDEGDNVCCAIRSTGRWVSLIEHGIVADADAVPLRIWRVQWARL